MFAECGISYAQKVDWEAPSHADGGPEGQVQPVAVPTDSGGAAVGHGHLSAGPLSAGPAVAAGDLSGDQDPPRPAPDAKPGSQAGASGQPDAAAETSRSWRSMLRRVAADPAGQGLTDQRRPRHSAARPNVARPRLARPHLTRPRAGQPYAAQPRISRPHAAEPHNAQPHNAQPDATQPDATQPDATQPDATQPLTAQPRPASFPLVSRPLISPRLAADPRVRIWATRAAITVGIYFGLMLWQGWRLGLTIAALYAAADIILRSKTTAVIPPSIRVSSAQRSTRRRLKVLQPAGYLALNACTIPGRQADTQSVIDHFVVGPAGVFALDSERWDRRLPVRTIGGRLYHGPVNQAERLKHSRWEAHQAAALLSAELGQLVKVHPAMVIYGPKIPWAVNKLQGVDVFDGGRVGTFFRRQSKATAGHQLDAGQIAAVYAAAMQAMPPMP